MKLNEYGLYAPDKFESKEEFQERFPELFDMANIDVYPALKEPKDSSNITPQDWCKIAEETVRALKNMMV